jgi:hypothetical protein
MYSTSTLHRCFCPGTTTRSERMLRIILLLTSRQVCMLLGVTQYHRRHSMRAVWSSRMLRGQAWRQCLVLRPGSVCATAGCPQQGPDWAGNGHDGPGPFAELRTWTRRGTADLSTAVGRPQELKASKASLIQVRTIGRREYEGACSALSLLAACQSSALPLSPSSLSAPRGQQ